ncbi:TetR/AcrR family transcriptional regulator [Vibrio europaeus]|uniref:TetR family transcriptional regulator n=1 Tax=Vibrio europaeus TaxID=300876 RepID=A0A178J7E2_9VIBR|nr:TetR/AcrR family transcriptional regulator [Vibrio europaeus]MDC5705409.1 TetR/AcrR family transcriptional regulator [Vibrio europaeus]MDC5710688.1 TetR/AcrR family transcriptional regulator [Vibrio europaeus]MDC5715778.1 TetR/AcrR family transcriptional regulator [Vibrio europaeus]MDC5719939.1 TetR/AcrR family transcriptional regulator [Vibrio europaeus]MDC5724174.1 TetR/AcrR family transcriptional regulator [Vibrio europaeus]
MSWTRARTDDKKNERKEAIYQAAFVLFKTKGYEGVSFNSIATEAGFTKSNMYRYFSSKEEIFLNIFAELFEVWFEDICGRLQKLDENEDPKCFAKTWVESLLAHPRFLDLTPILFISLEKNSSYEQLYEFKTLSSRLLYQITVEIIRVYPEFNSEKAFKFLSLSYAAMSTSWAANSQNEALEKLYQQAEFQALAPNFEHDLMTSLEVVIYGLKK